MSEQATVTTPSDRVIHIERVFEVPRDRLFEAFTDPELIPSWWGPRRITTSVEEMEPRRGGKWKFLCSDPESGDSRFMGTYREVSRPERIVQTFEWDGMPGCISLEEAEFVDEGERTRVVNECTFYRREERDGMLASGMEKGMNETFDRLEESLAG